MKIVFKTKTKNEIKPTLLFTWPASNFLEHIYSYPSPLLTSYVPPPEIYFYNLFEFVFHNSA